jgi:membrane protease YdiL (CAAX protease family)
MVTKNERERMRQDWDLWKRRWEELKLHVQNMPPLILAFVLLVLVNIPISFLSVKLGYVNQGEQELLKQYVSGNKLKDLIYFTVFLVPIQEEIWYRGLGRLVIFVFPPDTRFRKILAWLAILGPTYYWAVIAGGGHGIPADAFWSGLLFGWVMIETRSLESAIALHMMYNGVNLIGALIKYRLLI